MTKHKDRPRYPSKHAAIGAARRQQRITWRLYRVWQCVRCDNRWHAACWNDYAGNSNGSVS